MAETFLLLGGYGNAGRTIANLLLRETGVHVILAGRSEQKARDAAALLSASYGAGRVTVRQADASDASSVRNALEGASLLLAASSTIGQTALLAEAALAAHADYFDLMLSSPRKHAILDSLAPRVEQAGLCFITDGGYHPGVPAALVRYAAQQMEQLPTAVCAAVMRLPWGQYSFSEATLAEFAQELLDFEPVSCRDGKWSTSWKHSRKVGFGAPFGTQRCYPMRLEEMMDLPAGIPSLRETGFYIAGFDPVTDYAVLPAVLALVRIAPVTAGRIFRWSASTFGRPPYGFALQLEARGTHEGTQQRLTVRLAHSDGYFFTAAPVVACLKQYLSGSIRKPGVHCQANLVEPAAFLRDLERMGIAVEMNDRTNRTGAAS